MSPSSFVLPVDCDKHVNKLEYLYVHVLKMIQHDFKKWNWEFYKRYTEKITMHKY